MKPGYAIRRDGSDAEEFNYVIPKSPLEIQVNSDELILTGVPSGDQVEYVGLALKKNIYVVVHRPRITTDPRYVRLHHGSPENLVEPLVTDVWFDSQGFRQVRFRALGEFCSLWIDDNTIKLPRFKDTLNLKRLFLAH